MERRQEYLRYIKSEKWRLRCDAYWKASGRFCRACNTTKNLEVHHLSYDNFGFEPLVDLVGLCHACHQEVHRLHRKSGRRKNLRVVTHEFINMRRRGKVENPKTTRRKNGKRNS